MGAFPSFQSLLQEAHQGLVGYATGEGPSTKTKVKFAEGEMSWAGFEAMTKELITAIFEALDLDAAAWRDVSIQLARMEAAYYRLKCRTWTFAADDRQVVWVLASHFFVPGLARLAAFWSLEEAPDKGMPGGQFWYLPQLKADVEGARVHMPVAQVMDWLLDLMGVSLSAAASQRKDLTGKNTDRVESFMRTVYNWRSGESTPEIRMINEYFKDDAELVFQGVFVLPVAANDEERFAAALAFIDRKGLTAEALRLEIPMTQERLKDVLTGVADESEKQHFIQCLSERYGQPTLKLVRQRLLFARMVQDSYVRLLKFLCPNVAPDNADPAQNQLLQLIAIYQYVYNLTIAAHCQSGQKGEAAENAWFERQLRPWEAGSLYLSILPSRINVESEELAELLTRQFMTMQPGEKLEDQFGFSPEEEERIAVRRLEWLSQSRIEATAQEQLLLRLRRGSPWRALQAESNFWVISQISQHPSAGQSARDQALSRLRELASSDAERMTIMLAELHQLLNPTDGRYLSDAQEKVETLLAQAEANACANLWQAPLLHYRARHLLAMNEFQRASTLYRKVLTLCKEQGFGPLEGEAARDLMAIELGDRRLVPNAYDSLFLKMWREGIFEGKDEPRLEDVARAASEYFWSDLYRPYPGISRKEPVARHLISEALKILAKADFDSMRAWITANRKVLQKPLAYVQGDSIMMLFIKIGATLQEELSRSQVVRKAGEDGFTALQERAAFWRMAVLMLIELAPQQLNIADFKGQTPLMLMAESGSHGVIEQMLAAGADPDRQDYRQRTALHAAVRSGNPRCVELLLACPCRTDLVMHDGQTPLHTAVILGNLQAIRQLLEVNPALVRVTDVANGATPLEVAEELLHNPEARRHLESEMRRNGRRCATPEELQQMVPMLRAHGGPPTHG